VKQPRSNPRAKLPWVASRIGKKDGRYYFAMTGLTKEAIRRNNARLLKNNK
jgi:hypothetical protein